MTEKTRTTSMTMLSRPAAISLALLFCILAACVLLNQALASDSVSLGTDAPAARVVAVQPID